MIGRSMERKNRKESLVETEGLRWGDGDLKWVIRVTHNLRVGI